MSGHEHHGRARSDSDIAQRKIFIGGLSYSTDDVKLRKYFSTYGTVNDAVVMKDPVSGRSRGFGFITFEDIESVDVALENEPHSIDSRKVEAKRAVPRTESSPQTGSTAHQSQAKALQASPSKQAHLIATSVSSSASPEKTPATSPSTESSRSRSSSISTSETKERKGSVGSGDDSNAYCKIFVGGLHYDTRDADFRSYFEKFGKVQSVEVMFNRETNKSRGFGFVIFHSELSVDAVCEVMEHRIDDKVVEVKRAIPRSKIGPGGTVIAPAAPLPSTRSVTASSPGASTVRSALTVPPARTRSVSYGGVTSQSTESLKKVPVTSTTPVTKGASWAAAVKRGTPVDASDATLPPALHSSASVGSAPLSDLALGPVSVKLTADNAVNPPAKDIQQQQQQQQQHQQHIDQMYHQSMFQSGMYPMSMHQQSMAWQQVPPLSQAMNPQQIMMYPPHHSQQPDWCGHSQLLQQQHQQHQQQQQQQHQQHQHQQQQQPHQSVPQPPPGWSGYGFDQQQQQQPQLQSQPQQFRGSPGMQTDYHPAQQQQKQSSQQFFGGWGYPAGMVDQRGFQQQMHPPPLPSHSQTQQGMYGLHQDQHHHFSGTVKGTVAGFYGRQAQSGSEAPLGSEIDDQIVLDSINSIGFSLDSPDPDAEPEASINFGIWGARGSLSGSGSPSRM